MYHYMNYEPGQYLLLNYKDNYFLGVPLKEILGVYPKGEITPVPNTRTDILGLANLEGRIVPIHDTISRFNLKLEIGEEPYIVLLNTGFGELGILVPRDFDVIQISKKQIEKAQEVLSELKEKDFLLIPGKEKNIIILDIINMKMGTQISDLVKSNFAQKD